MANPVQPHGAQPPAQDYLARLRAQIDPQEAARIDAIVDRVLRENPNNPHGLTPAA